MTHEEIINKIQVHYFIKYGTKPDEQDAQLLDELLIGGRHEKNTTS